jgi:hypothetical protein
MPYQGTTDFANEELDKKYLREQGRTAMQRFAREMRGAGTPARAPAPAALVEAEALVLGPAGPSGDLEP